MSKGTSLAGSPGAMSANVDLSGLPVPSGEACETSAAAAGGAAGTAPVIAALDADLLLHGLGVLADLLGEASETMNQCLLTIEDKLQTFPITQEQWVPIAAALAPLDAAAARPDDPAAVQERVFGGVAVTIMKLGPTADKTAPQPAAPRHELGYAPIDGAWALVTRSVASDLKLLRDLPLEFRLKAIREVPTLLKAIEERRHEISDGASADAGPSAVAAGNTEAAAAGDASEAPAGAPAPGEPSQSEREIPHAA
jgi:hypothetical protein